MGSSLLSEPRRKRKRTARATASFRLNYGTAGKNEGTRCARCLPWIAGMFGLTMAVVVCVRNGFKDLAREKARDARLGRAEDHAKSHPLALLLEGQHDIGSQAARFADPDGHCLYPSPGADQPTAERLGVFTCLADTPFFLRALAESLRFRFLVVVDVGSVSLRHGLPASPPGLGAALTGLESEMFPEAPQLQAQVTAGEDPLPDNADLILIDVHKEVLSADDWVDLFRSLMRALSDDGVIVIRGPREQVDATTGAGRNEGAGSTIRAWYGSGHLWDAVTALACDQVAAAAAVGNLDGGIIVLRHAAPGEIDLETVKARCGRNHPGQQGGGVAKGAVAAAPPHPLRFERLFLWSTAPSDITTATAIEAVQAMFGGANEVRKYARRRYDRSVCLNTLNTVATGEAVAWSEASLETESMGGGHLRAEPRHIRHKSVPQSGAAPQWHSAARACLETHLEEHPQDVRAGFALEMVLRATGGSGVDRQVDRLRTRMTEESGPAGGLLWRALHARAAGVAATGLLL
ncbi:expressed unknown protein [Ectocarpus siliculosus]|uniref:Uncharacterized protein n=1 Tax=Ectocarpus siliculosus TaxID=2880 RepID=D7G833_ECTSI|nr:expressed unknown protein [Ectocarpus siliculosus]|eukprot:CBJ34016.1 expressed unknown protein [Ectocarpus siliculosus]